MIGTCLVVPHHLTIVLLMKTLILTLGRSRKVIPPLWHKEWGWGVDETAPRVFDMWEYSETILPSVESFWSSLQDEVYFMGGGAAGGLWRYQEWSPSWPPSWILPRIRNHQSSSSLLFIHGKNNQAKYTKYNILKMFTNYRSNGNSVYKDARWNK